jgi:hypothetical protein
MMAHESSIKDFEYSRHKFRISSCKTRVEEFEILEPDDEAPVKNRLLLYLVIYIFNKNSFQAEELSSIAFILEWSLVQSILEYPQLGKNSS